MELKLYGGPMDGLLMKPDPYQIVGSKFISVKREHKLMRQPVYKLSLDKEKGYFSHYEDEEK